MYPIWTQRVVSMQPCDSLPKKPTGSDHQRQQDKFFVEAEREFAKYIAEWNIEEIDERLIQGGIIWKFNPTAATRFGGAWERLVRSCKKAMYTVLGNR